MTHIALVEDDPGCQKQILDFLDRYSQESGEPFKVCVHEDGDSLIHSYRAQYDMLLMDIQMKFVDGMTAAREIRAQDDQVLIIFITNLAAYAIKGYEVDALDYVLKPVSYSAFAKSMGRALALALCLGCLAAFKYTGFFACLAGLDLSLQIVLPVGVSFYAFQTLSYVIDVYHGKREEAHFGYYALFLSFFPQLVAGPIERPEHLLPQLRAEREFSAQGLSAGGWLLLEGYFKKIVIADSLAPFVDRVYAAPGQALGPEIALATALFGLQIYCDFSGYSDIARGAARLLGVELTENFRRPYGAPTVRDFWRRWHISLTSWFTDYVYIPLGGNRRGLPRLRGAEAPLFCPGPAAPAPGGVPPERLQREGRPVLSAVRSKRDARGGRRHNPRPF